jgi:hypothetical protein
VRGAEFRKRSDRLSAKRVTTSTLLKRHPMSLRLISSADCRCAGDRQGPELSARVSQVLSAPTPTHECREDPCENAAVFSPSGAPSRLKQRSRTANADAHGVVLRSTLRSTFLRPLLQRPMDVAAVGQRVTRI